MCWGAGGVLLCFVVPGRSLRGDERGGAAAVSRENVVKQRKRVRGAERGVMRWRRRRKEEGDGEGDG